MTLLLWEKLASQGAGTNVLAMRAKVPGGWLVFISISGSQAGAFFYPDPQHGWNGQSLP